MSFLSGIGDLLKQYSANSATPATTPVVEQHFDQVAQAVPSSTSPAVWPKRFAPVKLPRFRRWPLNYSPVGIASNRRAC